MSLEVGDLVLIRQPLIKPYFHPLGIITETETNSLGEVVAAVVRKGNIESVRRHATDFILLEKCDREFQSQSINTNNEVDNTRDKSKRLAAKDCSEKIRLLGHANLI